MGMELPAELRNLFSVLTGSEWPTADETRLWELAQVYGTTADRLEIELPQLVIRIKNKVRENFDATAADFFDQSVDEFTAGQNNYLGEGTKVARGLQEYVHNAGTQVQYAKWMIIGQLVQLAVEIAWAIAMAPYTFGASLAKIPIFQAIARTVIGRVMFRLLSTLLQQMAISQFFALTLDALIQRIQIDQGNRDGWDHKLTEDAAKGAMLDGLFGTAAVFGGSALSNQFNKLLGNTTGPSITKQLDDNFPTGSVGGGPGGLPDGIGGVMGRNSDELLRPYGMDNRPGWNRPIDGERFRTDMGDQFANSLGGSMGKDQARDFGERYADAFTRNWGRDGLNDALNDVVSKYGRGLDPNMRDFLTTGVPTGVRDGLSDVGTHWKNFLAQLGGQGIANAAQGTLSEGFFNLLFSDQKTFSVTWLSGVSGLVSGAVQQSLTQGGLLLLDHLRNAGLPDGVPPPTPTPTPSDDGVNDNRSVGGDAGGSPDGNGNVSTSDSGSSSGDSASDASSSNGSSSSGEGGRSRDGQGNDLTNDPTRGSNPPPPPPPQQVTTESSDTNGRSENGSSLPETPTNENDASNGTPTTQDSFGQGSERPVNPSNENESGNDSDHLNRGGPENTSVEDDGAGDGPVPGGQDQNTGGQDRSPEETGDGQGPAVVDGPETTPGNQDGAENQPAPETPNQERPPVQGSPDPNPPVRDQPNQEQPPVQQSPDQNPPVQGNPDQNSPVQEGPPQGSPNPNPPVQGSPDQSSPVQESPAQGEPSGDGVVRDGGGPVQENGGNSPVRETPVGEQPPVQAGPDPNSPVQESPVRDESSGDGVVRDGGGPVQENGGNSPVRDQPNQEQQPVQENPDQNPPVQEAPSQGSPNPNSPVQGNADQNSPVRNPPVQGDSSGDGVVRDGDGSVRENTVEDTPVRNQPTQEPPAQNQPVQDAPNQGEQVQETPNQNSPVQGESSGDGVVRETGGPERETGPEDTPVRETPNPGESDQSPPVRETPNEESGTDGSVRPIDNRDQSSDQSPPAQGPADNTSTNGQPSPGSTPNATGQGSSDGNTNTHRPNGREGDSETAPDNESGPNDTRTTQDDTGSDVRSPGDERSGEQDPGATVHQNGDQQGPLNEDGSQGSTRDEDGSGSPVRQDDGSNEATARPDGTPVPVVMAPPLNPAAQGGQESTGDGRRNQTNTPPVSRPRPNPDDPAPVSDRTRPPTDWQDTRDSVEPTRVGGNRDRSGVDTDGVEILHGSTKDNPITSVAERGFDIRRVPLPDPGPDGPTHVTELTVRINFDTGPGVSRGDANTAQRIFLDRLNDVVNERYRLPDSGDQLHVRVEPVGPDGRPHSNVSWVRDNPDLPGRSDTANWRMDDGPDVWLHELLHRIGLNDESQDRSQDGSGRPRAVLRDSPDSTAVHEAGGYMDSPGGRDNRPPQILNHYLEQIETQANGASRYDPPARVGDLPDSVHQDLSQVLDPDGSRDHSDNVALFGAAYDSRVRGRGDDQVRADLPPRLRDDFDRTVQEWTSDGRWDQALDTARDAGMDAPLSQMPSGPTPVTTQGGGDHRAASPFSNPFKSKSGSKDGSSGGSGRNNGGSSRNNGGSSRDGGGSSRDGGGSGRNRRRPESHRMQDLTNQRDNEGDRRRPRRPRVTDDGGEGSSRAPRGTNPTTTGETPPPPPRVQDGTTAPTDTQQQVDGDDTRQDPPQIVVTQTDLTPPDPPPVTRPVTEETTAVLDALADIGPNVDYGGYSGMRMNPDADVDGLRDRMLDQIRQHGVEPDGPALTEAIERISGGRTTPGETIDVPVHDPNNHRDGDGDNQNPPPPRGNVQLSVDRSWRDITDSADRRVNAGNATENRAKTVGSGSQQSRKSVNVLTPVTVIGKAGGATALITPRVKGSFTVRQRGTEYQTSSERKHKRKVDVDGDDPARFTGDLVVNATLEVTPLPPRPAVGQQDAGGQQQPGGQQQRPTGPQGTGVQQQPGGQQQPQGTGVQQPAGTPVRVEFSDRLNDAFDIVLAGHLRDNDGETAPEHRPAPEEFRTDDPGSRVDGGNGTPIRAPRFSKTLGLIDDTVPPGFPVSTRTLLDNLPRADNGEVLRFPYQDGAGNAQFVEISGGPVNYRKVGPDLKDSSFTDTGKSSGNATFGAARTDKQEIRAGVSFLSTALPGDTVVVRTGPEAVGGVKGSQKHTRSTEYGSERVFGPGAKGDSAFYQVERTYRVTTTEQQPTPPSTENSTNTGNTGQTNTGNNNTGNTENTGNNNDGRGGRSSKPQPQPRVLEGTLDLTTLDQVSTADAHTLAGGGENRGAPAPPAAAPKVPGLTADGVRHLGEAVPLRAEWNDGRLRDGNGDSPMTVAAKRLHQQVFDLHPELVTNPSGAPGDRRGFWGSLWKGPDLRAQNTLAIYEQVGRAIAESDSLTTSGADIILRTGGLGNALTPAPGKFRNVLGTFLPSVRGDDRDGADFLTVRLNGQLSDPRFEGSRGGGSLSSGLGASTAQGSGKQNSIAYGGEITGAFQVRIGATAAGLPKGMVELSGGYTYEHETVKPFSGSRKGGVEAASKADGDLDTWSYELRLDASIGSNAPVRLDVTSQGGGPDTRGPRVVVEGPRTTPVPGELDRPGPNTDRSAEERAASDAAQRALTDAQEARRAVDLAWTRRDQVQDLARDLDNRQRALTGAEKNAETAEAKAKEARDNFQEKDEAATQAGTKSAADQRQAVQDRLEAAQTQQEAAEGQADAVRQMWDYVHQLQEVTDGATRTVPKVDLKVVPWNDRPATPEQGGSTSPIQRALRNWETALENWETTDRAKDEAQAAVEKAEADFREAAPDQPIPPEISAQRGRFDDTLRAARSLDDQVAGLDGKADESAEVARGSIKDATDLRAEANKADADAKASEQRAQEAREAAAEAQTKLEESQWAVATGLRDAQTALDEALDRERTTHDDAAAARGRGEDHRFALERDARLRSPIPANNEPPAPPAPGNQQNQGDQQTQGNQQDQDGRTADNPGGTPRPRPDLDLDSLPHAPKHSESPGLLDNLVDSVRSAPGFTAASRSGEAVMGTWRVLSSPQALAAHSMDVHDGGLQLQGQFEDSWTQRADLSLNVHAERESLHTSGVLLDSGVDLTFKAESDRVLGTSESSSHNVTIGLKGEAALNQADSRYNRVRGAAGFTPFATKQTQTQGDSTSFGEENKVSLPGSTVDVTTFDRFDVDTTIRKRWTLGAPMPFSKTVDGHGNSSRRGSAAEGAGNRNPPAQPQPQPQPQTQTQDGNDRGPQQDGQVQEEVTPAHHDANGHTDARFRVLDLAQKGALPGTAGLDTALARSRSVPGDIRVIPGREGSGHALNNIDSAAALDSINREVRANKLELTDQSQRDIRAALSPTNTRGLNLRYQTGGLALEVRFRNEFLGEQRPSRGGWLLLKLGPNGSPVFGPVESGMSSERSVSQSTEHNDSEGKQKKQGVTATLDGGVNPTKATGTDSNGDPTFPSDRYQSFAPNTGTGWETGTNKTHLTSDTDTKSSSRTVKAPGATGTTSTRLDFTVSVDNGKVFSSHTDVGTRTEVYQAGTFQPTPPAQPPVTSQPVPPPEAETVDVQSISNDWFVGLNRPQVNLPQVEAVGHSPIADAAVIAQARALDWEPGTGERNVTNAVDHLTQGRPGPRGPMLGAAVDQQVLNTLFGSSSTGDGATLVGLDKQGPFAVPGLETKLFTQVDPGGATIVGAVGDLSTGQENQNTHRDEDSVAHTGSTALNTGVDLSGMKGVDQSASGFDENLALIGGGTNTAGAKSSAGGGNKQSTSTVQTHSGAAVKGSGYLVRFPVDVLLVAQDTKSGGQPKAESTTSTVDVWLSPDQVRQIATGVSAESIAAWDTVAERQTRAAESEKALGTAVDNELGLDRSDESRTHAREATDLLALGPEMNPRSWSEQTADGVQAIREYLGSGADDRGWNRPADVTAAQHRAALDGLDSLRDDAGTPRDLSEEMVVALRDLVERRHALHGALSTHRTALDSFFTALREAFRPTPPPPPPPPPAPNTTGVNPVMQANFMTALNPT